MYRHTWVLFQGCHTNFTLFLYSVITQEEIHEVNSLINVEKINL